MNFDWHAMLGVAASVLNLSLLPFYIRSVTSSTTRPSAVSWFGWALLSVIAAAAQASKGIDWSLTIPIIGAISQTAIALSGFRTNRLVWTPIDSLCIGLAVIAVILWVLTKEPLVALILTIAADLAVTSPTIFKTYMDPASEPASLWKLYTLACVLAVVATSNLTIYNLLVPIYTVISSGIIALFAQGHLVRQAP